MTSCHHRALAAATLTLALVSLIGCTTDQTSDDHTATTAALDADHDRWGAERTPAERHYLDRFMDTPLIGMDETPADLGWDADRALEQGRNKCNAADEGRLDATIDGLGEKLADEAMAILHAQLLTGMALCPSHEEQFINAAAKLAAQNIAADAARTPIPNPAEAEAERAIDELEQELAARDEGWVTVERGNIYMRPATDEESLCERFVCTSVVVYSHTGCQGGVYMEASILAGDVVVGRANALTGPLQAEQFAVETLIDTNELGTSFDLDAANARCLRN